MTVADVDVEVTVSAGGAGGGGGGGGGGLTVVVVPPLFFAAAPTGPKPVESMSTVVMFTEAGDVASKGAVDCGS